MFNSFGEALKFYREKRKINQKQLALLMGIGQVQVNRHEKNKVKPEYDTVEKYTKALTLSMHESDILFFTAGYITPERVYSLSIQPEESPSPPPTFTLSEVKNLMEEAAEKGAKKALEEKDKKEEKPTFTHKDLIDITVSEDALATGTEKDIISGEVSCGTFSSVSFDESSGKIIIHPRIARKIDKFWKVRGESMMKFGFTPGMLVGIKFTKEISHNDIVLMAMYEIDSPPQLVLKQAKQMKSGEFIFQNGNGEPLELSENIEIIGKYIYKMDDPMNL